MHKMLFFSRLYASFGEIFTAQNPFSVYWESCIVNFDERITNVTANVKKSVQGVARRRNLMHLGKTCILMRAMP